MIRRTLQLIISVFAVFIISRVLIRALPGDPLDSLLAETALTIPRDKIIEDLGLHLPLHKSLYRDLIQLFHGQLGYSLVTREPVLETLLPRLLKSMQLALGALTIAIALGVTGGIFCAIPHESRFNRSLASLIRSTSTLVICIPLAWIGPVALYLFAVLLPWTEFQGSLGLACLSMALPLAGGWVRLVETRTKEEMQQPFFRATLARGTSIRRAVMKSGLAPSGGALIAMAGSQAGSLLAGSFIAEWIFDWPGMGIAWVQAALQRDYPMMEASTFLGACLCLIGVYLGDLLQEAWDPRQGEPRS